MDKDWIQERIDEMYVLEKKSYDRVAKMENVLQERQKQANRVFEDQSEGLKEEKKYFSRMVKQQEDRVARLANTMEKAHEWYTNSENKQSLFFLVYPETLWYQADLDDIIQEDDFDSDLEASDSDASDREEY